MIVKRAAVFVAAAFGAYVVLLVVMLGLIFASGGGVSCSSSCTGVERWLNDASPVPLIVAIGLSVAAGVWAAGRVRPPG